LISSMIALPRLLVTLAFLFGTAFSFAPASPLLHDRHAVITRSIPRTRSTAVALSASGFDIDNPFNPFKNPEVEGDPARLLSTRLRGCNLYLVGMMGSGKSAVGKALAGGMGYTFLDTDRILEQAAGVSIPQIFEEDGEVAFRKAETQVLESVGGFERCLGSTGGGLVVREENWKTLRTGVVLYLNVAPTTIMTRIRGTDRPLLQTDNPLETLISLVEMRRERYERADVVVNVKANMDVQMTADACVKALHEFVDGNPPVIARFYR